MSTSIEFIPTIDTRKVTDFISIDDDLKCTVRVSDNGVAGPFQRYNFSTVQEGSTFQPQTTDSPPKDDPNVGLVRVAKDGANAVATIPVKVYYAEGATGINLPRAWIYNRPYTVEDSKKDTFTESDLELTVAPQTFPIIVWNRAGLSGAQLPGTNTATSVTIPPLYSSLGSVENRREYIKSLIRSNINHPHLAYLLSPANYRYSMTSTGTDAFLLHTQYVLFFYEMLARAISIDNNLQDTTTPTATVGEQKFNLLAGDASIDIGTFINQCDFDENNSRRLTGAVAAGAEIDRSTWNYVRVGGVNPTSPYAYLTPTLQTHYSFKETNTWGISLTGANVGSNWLEWLRS